jgi:[acyl-carrier-protein] S-malonyltransferase
MDLILVFPGQGSQKPGMARDLAEVFPAAADTLEAAEAALGVQDTSLRTLMFDGPADDLTQTRNAQPALLAHGAALWSVLQHALSPHVRAAAGHSLGEFTAYHTAGSLSVGDAARLVRTRGELMYRTGVERPGAMAAILGTLTKPVADICRDASEAGLVSPANFNTDEQLVISGEVAGVERAMELCKAAGAKRAVRLNVSGAFHSSLMEPAVAGLRDALGVAPWNDPRVPVYANVDAEPRRSAAAARDALVRQLTAPVRWAELVRRLAADFPGALFVELGPGNVLTGLIKRLVPGADAVACGTANEVTQLLARVNA